MSNNKHFADLLKVCSILPALAIMPAMAGVEDYIWNPNFDSYTLEADEKLPNPDSVENAQFNGMRSPTGKFELDGSNFTLDANGWAGLSVGADEEFNMHDFKIVKNFEKAASGGAFLSITGGVLTIDNVHFMNNSSAGGGAIASGAASAQDGGQAADVAISNSKFTANSATSSGGAISNNASLLKLSNVDFVGNMSGRDGGAVDNNNGGILEISNGAVFKNNIATQNGGAIFAGDVSVIGDILFEENEALNAGAVHVGNKSFVVKKDAQGNDNTVTFKKNVATGNAGAFFVGANGTVDITATNIDFIENSGASNGGTIYVQDGTLKLLGENNTFFNNQSTKSEKTYKRGGGVIHNQINSAGSTIVIGGSENSINSFTYNKAVVNGGAILSRGDGNGYESNMTLNGTTVFEENDAGMNGGALYQYVNAKDTMNVVFNGNVDFDDNNAGENGGAIFNYSSVDGIASIKFNGEVEFENNIAGQNGGAIYNNGTLDLTGAESTFVENKANGSGGAIYNAGTLNVADAIFDANESQGWGGAIYNTSANGELYVKDSEFLNNSAVNGAAISAGTSAKSTVIESSLFQGNTATSQGAVGLFSNGSLTDVIFKNNNVTNAEGDGAGALFLGSLATVTVNDVEFIGNTSAANGGAIATRIAENEGGSKNRNDGTLDIVDGEFVSNSADGNGGAIYNTFHNSVEAEGAVHVEDVEFIANSAKGNGGAIYNDGTKDLKDNGGVMNLNDIEFAKNKADGNGGAVYNSGKLSIADAIFDGNESQGWGGAIYNTSANGDLYVKDSEFLNNSAVNGAAISAGTSAKSTVIESSLFQGNTATSQGTVGLFSNGSLTDVIFKNNKVTNAEGDGAGALFLGSLATVTLNDVEFIGNTSASRGGAIATRVAQNEGGSKNRNDGMLDIIDSTFVKNTAATDGGAIYNTFYNSVEAAGGAYVAKSSFVGNKATNGGAIYNDGTEDYNGKHAVLNLSDLTFADNIASDKGGAIYNGENATIYMSGINAFTNNIANKGANDIYNAGTLNITGGETTIGGGILGNGTLTLAEGAVLNVGNATIRQDNLDIDGIVKVSVLSDRSYGRLIAAENLDVDKDTAELHLSLGSVGEYNMFGGKDAGFSTIKYGDTYNVTELGGGIIKVETKSVEQLAQDTGLTTQAAGVVAGLANSHDSSLQKVSLAAQQALNAGDKALVEQETKKLNPEEKPVVQAVASAVQNQVLSLASGRMAGGVAMGRAGGDSSQENGFWMHGLFNKSKLDGQFHGYTRGVAFGMDTIIDGKYILGGGLAFNNSDVHSSGRGDTDIDSKTLFLYGQYKPNNWFANMTLTYNMAEYDETKSVFGYNINNVYDVDSYGAQIMGGYDFNTGITTEAGLRYLHIDQDAYADISATKTDFLTSVAGIKYAFAIENDWAIELRPELRAALTYDIISEADAATIDMPGVASYKVAGEKLDRLGGEFGIGLTADYKGLKVTLMYDLDLHKDYTSQTGMIKFRTQF